MSLVLPLIVINGPTASGKSSLAIDVAERLIAAGQPAEIVNADAYAIYRGMDIGTAKPSAADLVKVKHHLVDILDITETASVAEFQTMARDVIADLRAAGITPVLVGGSALYVRAVVDTFDFPGTDPAVRAKWDARLTEIGPEALHAELAAISPEAAAGILPGNGRRIVRALEVIELTGSFTPVLPEPTYALANVHQFGLRIDREQMDARIAARVEQMWAHGLVAEVEELVAQGLRQGLTASRALGYAQVLAHLAGECSDDEAKQATIAGTRRFARKQLGWFNRDDRITWFDWDDPTAAETIIWIVGDN